MKIHILGASGSGTTTSGIALSRKSGIPHFDSDEFFWEKTDPPFTQKRTFETRQSELKKSLSPLPSWILTGSMMGWGDFLRREFDLVVYLYIPPEIRIKRLIDREKKRYGDRIEPGNDMFQLHQDFIEWAKKYEDGGMEVRSRKGHREWMKDLSCEILKIEGEIPIDEGVRRIMKKMMLYAH